MKKTVTASLCMALMISSVSAGAAESDVKILNKYISDKKICITENKCIDFGKFICKGSLFSCIFGDNKFPESNKPSVEVKPETEKPSVDASENSLAEQVLILVNEFRAENGKKALVLDEKLNSVAYAHSLDMKNNNYFSHTNLKGQSPFDRLKNAGISYTTAGENIAMGQKSAEAVVSSWINSEGHRKNLLGDSFGKMGLGAVKSGSGYYWTQIFTN